MHNRKGRVFGFFVPLAAVVILVVLLVFALIRLAQIQNDMRMNASANMLWVITQTQVKGLRLSAMLERHMREGHRPEQVLHAYQLLNSRFNLLSAGPQRRYLDSLVGTQALKESIQAVQSVSERLPLMLKSSSPAEFESPNDISRLRVELDNLDKHLAGVASRTMVAQWEELGSRIDRYRNGVLTIILIMLGICVCGLIISVRMFIALRRVRETEWAKRQAIQLQSQLDAQRQISDLHRNFGAMVSHQFRTPLAIIDASMQRILRTGDRIDHEELKHRVKKVRRATARLARLVEHTRIADQYSELLDVNLQRCALGTLVEMIVRQQQEIAPHRVIELDPGQPDVPDAYCDPVLVEHIIFNFLSNAVKYSPDHTPIHVAVTHEGDKVCCLVRDQGAGITEHDLPYVFDRYFRGHDVADIPGTGMGLYVACTLAKMQSGVVSVRSDSDKGSVFQVCFPVATDQGGSIS